ncbi:hypothetical protein G9C85_16715 [Halorubellus sp. JP-L1]|uniref:hypothetical protein n=1 Tax=Halorubellus sp. JP-L1 TaxID=2715753 RepID=UPI00140DAA34|nr:hypothetical protein [Halorubellus sp. JP-L1]NHN43261.1 hypothetical protein [Halorubellus sp. JP-L1]
MDFVELDSSASLLDANGDRPTDDSRVTAKAESTAFNFDDDSNGDAAVDKSNYVISDAVVNTLLFSEFSLDAGAQGTLHTYSH